MFLDYYQLQRNPFTIATDPEFLYWSPGHRKALETIACGVFQRQGLVAVIGAAGLGKTVLLQAFLRKCQTAEMKALLLSDWARSPAGLTEALCRKIGPSLGPDAPGIPLKRLHRALVRENELGNTVVLLVDDAQNLPEETLHHLHGLSNLENRSGKLLQIVLVGRTEFWTMLERHELRPLKQRVALVARLSPLTREESRNYVLFRLGKAGAQDRPLFTEGALKGIGRLAEGIPLEINILCNQALKTGAALQKPVTAKIVAQVAKGLVSAKRTNGLRLGLPALTGTLILSGFLWPAADARFFDHRIETLLRSLREPSSSRSIAIGPVIQEGISEAVVMTSPFRPLNAGGGLLPAPTVQPVRETPNPLPQSLEKEIVRAGSGIGPKTRPPEKIGLADEKGAEKIPPKPLRL